MHSEGERGVLLLNLGGPETLEDVRPFLYNLFSDPDIIRIGNDALRKMLAWTIATARQRKSRALYRRIGGGSPLRRITEGQAAALESALAARGTPARVYVGMRCWKPSIDEAVDRIRRDGVRRLLLLPLFPQYSETTTGSCFRHFRELDARYGLGEAMEISSVKEWFGEPLYLGAMAELIRAGLGRFPAGARDGVHLLYSAHSLPARYVREGDPYLDQTRECVDLVNRRLGTGNPSTLAFQSKVGPVEWLGPDTRDVLGDLARQGVRRVLAVPVSFVSDHIETLEEIDIEYRELAAGLGIAEFHRADAPNLHPRFIEALAAVVLREWGG